MIITLLVSKIGTMKTGSASLADWSIDGMIEHLQHNYKFTSFKNTEDNWVKHSINMPLTSMSIIFKNSMYGKPYGVASMQKWNSSNGDLSTTDKATRKNTPSTRHMSKNEMISEIIKESKMLAETANWKVTGK
jgi:hypothetical protein